MVGCDSFVSIVYVWVNVQVVENMKSLEAIPKLTPEVMEKIELVIKSKPAEPVTYR